MESYGSFADSEDLADFPIGLAVLHPIENRDFSRGQSLDASIRLRERLRSAFQKSHMNIGPQVLDERNQSLPIEGLLAGKRTECRYTAGLIDRARGNAVAQAELARGRDKLLFLLGRHVPIDLVPMLGAW